MYTLILWDVDQLLSNDSEISDNRQRPVHRNSGVICAVHAEMIEAGQVSERRREAG
jgi:hypothetical protein